MAGDDDHPRRGCVVGRKVRRYSWPRPISRLRPSAICSSSNPPRSVTSWVRRPIPRRRFGALPISVQSNHAVAALRAAPHQFAPKPDEATMRNATMPTSTRPIDAVDALAPTNVRWRIFLLMLMLIAINYVDRASISVAMPAISKEFNIDLATQGFILSSFLITYALMQIPGGMLADRFKPRIVIALATLGWGFFQAVAAVSFSAWVLVLTRLGLGVSEAPIYPAGGKLNAIWMTSNERARGATLLDGGAPLGAAFGSLIIAGLIG